MSDSSASLTVQSHSFAAVKQVFNASVASSAAVERLFTSAGQTAVP